MPLKIFPTATVYCFKITGSILGIFVYDTLQIYKHMQNHPALPLTLPPGNWGFHSAYLGYSSEFSPKSTNIMFRGLPMSFLVREPKLCKVSNKTEERDCVILRDWG